MKSRQIAPRLANGDSRDRLYNRLPPEVKAGIRLRALRDGQSVSWIIEQAVIEYFGLRQPKYVKPKPALKLVATRRRA